MSQKALNELSNKASQEPILEDIKISQKASTNEKVHFEASCKSLATCSACQKEFQELSEKASDIQICVDCESSIMSKKETIEKILTQPSCKSLAQCSVCQKAFDELLESPFGSVCNECKEEEFKKISADTIKSQKSLAACHFCRKEFENENGIADESKPPVCTNCRQSIISQFETQLNKIYKKSEVEQEPESEKIESNMKEIKSDVKKFEPEMKEFEPEMKGIKPVREISVYTMKFNPSCKSLAQCSVCQKGYVAEYEEPSMGKIFYSTNPTWSLKRLRYH